MNWNRYLYQTRRGRREWSPGGRFLTLGLLLLNACAMADAPGEAAEPADETAETVSVPEGAIPVAPELYMLPMGEDETGCPVFQPWSPTHMVVQALHWRAPDGSFTLDRAAADCPPRAEP